MLWPLLYSLHYLGFEVLRPFLTYAVQGHGYTYENQGEAERRLARKLDSWEDRLAGVWNEAAQSFPGWPDWDHHGQPLS